MKKFILILLGFSLFHAAMGQMINDPNAEVRVAKDFHGISVSNAFDVYLTQGTTEAVAVSAADTRIRNLITVEVKGGILYIGMERDSWNLFRGNKKLKAYISFRNIDKFDANGACDVFIQGTWNADNLKLGLSGASNIKGKVDMKTAIVDLSGASDATLTGKIDKLTVDASGASKCRGEDLVTEFCNARATGASEVRITVNKELSAQASGASHVRYKGDGLIRDLKTSGASKISKI